MRRGGAVSSVLALKVGVRALVHFVLDDLYPAVFRPIVR